MNNQRTPDNPLEFIQHCISERKIVWTYHVNMRLEQRHIPREYILHSSDNFEIVESYPDDRYFPSYLIYSHYQGVQFHIVFGTDMESDNIRIVTAYFPDLSKWENDFKTRKVKL